MNNVDLRELGKGQVGGEELKHMIAAAKAPVISETRRSVDDLRADVAFVRSAIR